METTPGKTAPPPTGEQIVQTANIGGTPGGIPAEGTPVEPQAGQTFDITAYANREYVAGGGYFWYANIARALPWNIDDVSRDFGDDIYERMLLDPQVRAVFNSVKASILEDGLNISSPVENEEEDGYDQAADLVTAVEFMLDNLPFSIEDILWNMLDALGLGNKIAELIFAVDSTFTGKTQILLNKMVVKPRESYSFIVDTYINLLGVLGRIPGQPFGVQQGMLLADVPHITNLLPPAKFAILTHRPNNNDPRGTSLLRACFDPWNAKSQLKAEYLKYLTQFATPSLIGYTAEGAQAYANGTDPATGDPIIRTPEQDMLQAMQNFHNSSALALPFGAKVDPVEMEGNGEAFQSAFDLYDRQIAKAITSQTLATEQADAQSRAAAGTHKDVFDTIIHQARGPVVKMITSIIRTWMLLNGVKVDPALLPVVSLGQAESEDLPRMWTAAAALESSGYLDRSQYPELDRQIGLPERDAASLEDEEEPAPPYVVPGSGPQPPPVSVNAAPAKAPNPSDAQADKGAPPEQHGG